MSDGAVRSVVHLSTWDNRGGSGRAAYRIHTGLRRHGVRSRMLVGYKATDDPDVRVIGGRVARFADRACGRAVDAAGLQYLGHPLSYLLGYSRWVSEADVIQVFNTHGGYLSHAALAALSRTRPLVWRLSDMWPLTGHCGYAYECDRWTTGCGACPHLDEYPALRHDTSALLWRIKRAVYARSRFVIVSPTRWLAGLVRRSPLLDAFPVHHIPNGLDTTVFRPLPRAEARRALDLDDTDLVVLFGAVSLTDERKGARFLGEALARLASRWSRRVRLLMVGGGAAPATGDFPTRRLPFIDDDARLAQVYAAADVFVLPTVAENLANAILESMACGTPVVSFDVGGVGEVVRHMETGYLAAARDAADLAHGLDTLLADGELRQRLGRRARDVAATDHDLDRQTLRFLELYRDTVADRAGGGRPVRA